WNPGVEGVMNRGFTRSVCGGALLMAVLCLFVSPPAAAQTCEPRTAAVLYVDNDAWRPDLGVTSPTGATVRLTDCAGLSFMTAELAPDGAALLEDFAGLLCSSNQKTVGIAHLEVREGCAEYFTEAIYADALGNFNVVYIPELTSPLGENEDSYLFTAIRSAEPRSTFVVLVAEGGLTRARVDVSDESGQPVAGDVVSIGASGWAWYEVPTPVEIGSLLIRNLGPGVGIGSPAPTKLYAVAFSGYRGGGSPKEVLPQRITDLTPSQ
ncbi:MAG: hypothetical protein ACXW5J_26770, partial [Thermoanaerobaculia bacterium]